VSGEAYNVNKQTTYIVPKSTNESRAQYIACQFLCMPHRRCYSKSDKSVSCITWKSC